MNECLIMRNSILHYEKASMFDLFSEIDVRLTFAFANYGGKKSRRKREKERGKEKSCFENESALSATGNANEPLIMVRVRQSYTRTDSFRGTNAEILGTTS